MVSKKVDQQWILKLEKGEEIVQSVTKFCIENEINLGSMTGIGAVDNAKIGFFDTKKQKYETKNLSEDYEITSLNGNISMKEGKPFLHLHITLANNEYNLLGGHLFEATVSATCEIFLSEITGIISRKLDPTTGLYLLDL